MAWEIKWQATGATHTDINTLDDATRKDAQTHVQLQPASERHEILRAYTQRNQVEDL